MLCASLKLVVECIVCRPVSSSSPSYVNKRQNMLDVFMNFVVNRISEDQQELDSKLIR